MGKNVTKIVHLEIHLDPIVVFTISINTDAKRIRLHSDNYLILNNILKFSHSLASKEQACHI